MSDKKRLNVHLYVTPICNLKCKHCYYDAWPPGSVVDRLLTIREMSFIITTLCDGYEAAFDTEGGEFFWREDIPTLFGAVPSHYWNNVTITTNGTVEIKVAHRHLRHLDDLRVSVEGHTDELQRDIRGISLEPVLNTCKSLHSSGIPITLRITLHKKNYEHLLEMVDCFVDLGITRFSLYEFQPVGRGRFYKHEYGLKSAEIEDVLRLLCSGSITDGLKTLKLSLGTKRIPLVVKYKPELISRGYKVVDLSGIPSLTINYNGDLGICPWNVGSNLIGVFREGSFVSDVAKYLQTGRLNHECNHCSSIRVAYEARE